MYRERYMHSLSVQGLKKTISEYRCSVVCNCLLVSLKLCVRDEFERHEMFFMFSSNRVSVESHDESYTVDITPYLSH
jgi:hypothetical protein